MAELDYDTEFPFDDDEELSLPPRPATPTIESPTSPPSSPRSPTSSYSRYSLSASPTSASFTGSFNYDYPPRPRTPGGWIWRCHMCGSHYPLGATRRCLSDGHYYCAGQGADRNVKPKRRGQPCFSIFDYKGWEAMNVWRKQVQDIKDMIGEEETSTMLVTRPNCWDDCDFPSACRYLDTIQDTSAYGYIDSRTERSLLRNQLGNAEKRKALFDQTEGVTHQPPYKITKIRVDPEPEPEYDAETETTAEEEPIVHEHAHPLGVRLSSTRRPDSLFLLETASETRAYLKRRRDIDVVEGETSSVKG
ncbi:hypothetical protein FQN54_001644 [Arachnomyces sp. PD_36]|nr:hypothetical protein FQN54_001644 [Arachnomyces sp. PD_36]